MSKFTYKHRVQETPENVAKCMLGVVIKPKMCLLAYIIQFNNLIYIRINTPSNFKIAHKKKHRASGWGLISIIVSTTMLTQPNTHLV